MLLYSVTVYVALFNSTYDILLDIDECSTEIHNCSQLQNEQCDNRPGTFVCECISGYEQLNGICKG